MNKEKKIIIFALLSFLITIIFILFLMYPKFVELNIRNEIKKANYCEIDSDCVDAGGKCPFGCYVYVNKNEVDKISKLIRSFDSKCIYGCVSISNVICKDKKCVEIFE